MDPFFLSLFIALFFSLGMVVVIAWYLMSLRRQLRIVAKVRPKGKTLVISHRDIGPIIGTDTVVEFEKIPGETESDSTEVDEFQDETDDRDAERRERDLDQ
jgi:hypothetical protein